MKSKNGVEIFMKRPYAVTRCKKQNIFRTDTGPYRVGNINSPSDAFCLYINAEMIQSVVNYTNDYAKSVDNDFKETNIKEIYKYIGCQLFIGIFQAKTEKLDEMWSDEFGRPFIKKAFTRHRFRCIKRFLRTDNRRERVVATHRKKLDPIRKFWNDFIVNCQKFYKPEVDVTIDEMMIPFRGKCSFKMYLPSKPCKYGIKIFAAVEKNSKYFYNGKIYEGKCGQSPEKNQAFNVCIELMNPLLNRGYNLCTDNYYSSFDLARFLLRKKTSFVGTLRKNKPQIPIVMNTASKREVKSSIYGYQKDLTVLSYVTKKSKYVLLLSTLHIGPQKNVDNIPEIINDYNVMKTGVDVLDQILGYYTCRRGTNRWPYAVWMHMMDLAAHNAYVIFKKLHPEEFKSRRDFLLQLAKDLVGNSENSSADEIACNASKKPKSNYKKRCFMCISAKDRKIKSVCHSCEKNVCSEHSQIICNKCFRK